jgi:hypothetical protein
MSSSPTTSIRPPRHAISTPTRASLLFSVARHASPATRHDFSIFPSFVFNSLLTLLQLGGRGRVGTNPKNQNSSYSALCSSISALLSPVLAALTESSILRSLQVLCLPLLRKLPGCSASLPNLKPRSPRHALLWSAQRLHTRFLSSFNFRLSTFNFLLFPPLRLARLIPLAAATGEVTGSRQLGAFVHRAIHADVDALHVAARAAGKYSIFSHSASPAYRPCTKSSTVFTTIAGWSIKVRWPALGITTIFEPAIFSCMARESEGSHSS